MAHISHTRSMAIGAALAALTAVACLWAASLTDAETCSLAELERSQSVLMSCEHQSPVGAALMWCVDPDSPQCIPALPQPPRPELWDRTDVALLSLPDLPRTGYVWMTWPAPMTPDMPGRTSTQRLERPPRA